MKTHLRAALALITALWLAVCALPVSAAEALPESPHPYENSATHVQRYTCADAPRGVFVTFSEDTYTEPYESTWIVVPKPDGSGFTLGDVISQWVRSGDYIAVLDADRNRVGTYSGDRLAGKTVYVPTASFEILLVSDAENNAYGYRVTEVRPAGKEDVRLITYRDAATGRSETVMIPRGEGAYFLDECYIDGSYCTRDGYAFSGWATVPGGKVIYDPDAEIPADMGDMELWAAWTPLQLKSDEVLAFSNSSWYFEDDGRENYYLSAEDYQAMQLNLYKTYGLGPVPGPVLSVVLATYPNWEWQGSCYGMSTVVALQHLGMIDLLSAQNAACVSELEADDRLISRINYYQSQAATSWLTENKAYDVGTAGYRAQLMRLYEAVENGGIALFTFYPEKPFVDTGHTVLFTGAYTRGDGSHVLIAYDCNDAWSYLDADYDSRFVISPDFSSIVDNWEDDVGAFNWTADFDQFSSFDAEGKGSPLPWYKALLRHFTELIETLKTIFSNLKGVHT